MPLVCHENMIYNNQFQIKQSNRFVFSKTNNFELARSIIEEDPLFGASGRRRVVTSQDKNLGIANQE
jgi:hypothetical protein